MIQFAVQHHAGMEFIFFKCEECPTYYTENPSVFQRHILYTHGDAIFGCSDCSATFKHPDALTLHRREAHGGKYYICQEHKFCTIYKRCYDQHISAVHEDNTRIDNQRLKKCPECSEGIETVQGMRRHRQQAHAIRHFVCLICNLLFETAQQLKSHQKNQRFKYGNH